MPPVTVAYVEHSPHPPASSLSVVKGVSILTAIENICRGSSGRKSVGTTSFVIPGLGYATRRVGHTQAIESHGDLQRPAMPETVIEEAIEGNQIHGRSARVAVGSADSASASGAGGSCTPELRAHDNTSTEVGGQGRSNSFGDDTPSRGSRDISRRSMRSLDKSRVTPVEEASSSGSTASFFSPMPSLVALDECQGAGGRETSADVNAALSSSVVAGRGPALEPSPSGTGVGGRGRDRQGNDAQTPGERTPDQTNGTGQPAQARNRGFLRRALLFLGYGTGNERRKELVSLLWTCAYCFVQFSVIFALSIYSGLHRSPTQPSRSEWAACDKPLGVWACLWLVKLILQLCMGIWTYHRALRAAANGSDNSAEQSGSQSEPTPRRNPSTASNAASFRIGEEDYEESREAMSKDNLFTRLSAILTLLAIAWFLTANILIYSSLDTCRSAAPHLWWLVFAVLCVIYILVFEMVVVGFIFFIIWPIFYLAWNLFLICLGRHPIQNPHYINPEVGKIPKGVVDKIPLVLYIPSPSGDEKPASTNPTGMVTSIPTATQVQHSASTEHTYPPSAPPRKRRFVFLKRKRTKSGSEPTPGSRKDPRLPDDPEKPPEVWEDLWEGGEYPFVRLDENRASCAICLLDFAEPKRRVAREVIEAWAQGNKQQRSKGGSNTPTRQGSSASGRQSTRDASQVQAESLSQPQQGEVREEPVAVEGGSNLRLEDAGEEAQPLRLLPCGHVFHQTCIDPWLTDVSGRCPTCQQPILPQKKGNRGPDATS